MDEAAPRLARSLLPPNSALRSSGYKKEGDKEKAASQQAPTEAAKKQQGRPSVCRNGLRTDPGDCAGIRTGNRTRERPPPSRPPHLRASWDFLQQPKGPPGSLQAREWPSSQGCTPQAKVPKPERIFPLVSGAGCFQSQLKNRGW